MKIISLDTETTGIDLYHSARPFFVTSCDEQGSVTFWEWDVDPLTRQVKVPIGSGEKIRALLDQADHIVLQNGKFDAHALAVSGLVDFEPYWPKVYDTLLAGHLLDSGAPHNLTDMALHYLGEDIQPLEDALEEAVKKCRQQCRLKSFIRDFGHWMIAKEGVEGMPSAKKNTNKKEDKQWKYDTWLPRAFCRAFEFSPANPWWGVLRAYANADSAVTLALWKVMEEELHRRGLWEIYQARLKLLPIAYGMERRGVTVSKDRHAELVEEFKRESAKCGRVCVNIAESYDWPLTLPKGGAVNNSLRDFCFEVLKLEPVRNPKAKSDAPSLDSKNAIPFYLRTLEPGSLPLLFVRNLATKRTRDTALSYLDGYKRFWIPLGIYNDRGEEAWYCLHPNLNPTGTATLRWSSSNPNEQNISKRGIETGIDCPRCSGDGCKACDDSGKLALNVRHCFGPAPGREWWSCDAKNIERRIPAYKAPEPAIIALFERPDEPPYYGSEHLLVAHILFPREFEECRGPDGQLDGRIFKKRYADTLYQRVKNFDFAVQYGAVDRADGMGTADRTVGIAGAHSRVKDRFSGQTALNDRLIWHARKYGYIETVPDTSVNPEKGYPLLCARTTWGEILPTTPLNYWGQGTACWWMMRAMTRCEAQLAEWNRTEGFDGFIALQVHDELVFDLPKSKVHPKEEQENTGNSRVRGKSNLWRVRKLQELMAVGGDHLGIPTPVSCEYNEVSWSEGVSL